ncbi:hypothetical protein [Acanthopleuribacter pedis]|uniref:Uncharacterized protein n=1 Tax=Acanthopleuribacter pedis TaxID=442870 RepID=A0A8J7U1Z3_9BACT|nr:hypothetical protein [Acanthopleuribacter pedis]MBO1318723.1 hypothetical protein [Acanthopleuribacter pedis]
MAHQIVANWDTHQIGRANGKLGHPPLANWDTHQIGRAKWDTHQIGRQIEANWDTHQMAHQIGTPTFFLPDRDTHLLLNVGQIANLGHPPLVKRGPNWDTHQIGKPYQAKGDSHQIAKWDPRQIGMANWANWTPTFGSSWWFDLVAAHFVLGGVKKKAAFFLPSVKPVQVGRLQEKPGLRNDSEMVQSGDFLVVSCRVHADFGRIKSLTLRPFFLR